MAQYGSSPRGRGTLMRSTRSTSPRRFIPAWAGNAAPIHGAPIMSTVHPRVGGERVNIQPAARSDTGSSPRGRGTRLLAGAERPVVRFIPAWAGNAPCGRPVRRGGAVHPRVGGERVGRDDRDHAPDRFIPAWAGNAPAPTTPRPRSTVHPRVGGERCLSSAAASTTAGSSPRGRGTLAHRRARRADPRFIPAWAGNAKAFHATPDSLAGSSPRGRGTLFRFEGRSRVSRFIPAWAGNARPSALVPFVACGSSPRGRGTRPAGRPRHHHSRFIPAWAGNARPAPSSPGPPSVHPRVGGERSRNASPPWENAGSSPRGRGTQRHPAGGAECRRFIPAWAGNAGVAQEVEGIRAGSSPRGRGTPRPDRAGGHLRRFIPAWAGNAVASRSPDRAPAVHPRVGGERAGMNGE